MANKRPSGSYQDWQDDADSPWVNILIGITIIIIVLGVGATVYLNQDRLFGDANGGDKTADTNTTTDESGDADTETVDDENTAEDATNEEVDDETSASASNAPPGDDSAGDDNEEVIVEADENTDDTPFDESTVEDDTDPANEEISDTSTADEEDADDEEDSAPSGRVNLIENVPMRDILSIYAYPNPNIKLFSVLENFSPHAAGRYENWVYVYYFYTEVVMDEDGESVVNRYNELRDGWIARGRLQLTDAQFNSLRVLNPDNLPALPNLEYNEETALPFVGLREVTPPPAGDDGSEGSEGAEGSPPEE